MTLGFFFKVLVVASAGAAVYALGLGPIVAAVVRAMLRAVL